MLSIAAEMSVSAAPLLPVLISFLIIDCKFKSHCGSIQPSVPKSQVIKWCRPWAERFICSPPSPLNPQFFYLMKFLSSAITYQPSNTQLLISIAETSLTLRMFFPLKRMLRWGSSQQKWRSRTSAHLWKMEMDRFPALPATGVLGWEDNSKQAFCSERQKIPKSVISDDFRCYQPRTLFLTASFQSPLTD